MPLEQIAGVKGLEKIDAVKEAEKPDSTTNESIIEKIKTWLKKKERIERCRAHNERQWLTNIAFLFGKQHFSIQHKDKGSSVEGKILWELKNLERQKKTLITVNYILPLYRSILSRLTLMKSRVFTEAETQEQRDVDSSKVAQELLEDHWKNVNKSNAELAKKYVGMTQTITKALSYALSMGQGTLFPVYNEKAKGRAYIDGEIIESEIGMVETEVLHNFQLFMDPMGQFAFISRPKSIHEIWRRYGVEVEPDENPLSDFEKQLVSLLDGTTEEESVEDSVREHIFMHLPCKEYPNGFFRVFTDSVIIQEGDLPKYYGESLPLFTLNGVDIPLSPFPQGMVEQLIPLQEDLNFTVKRIRDYKKWMTGKILMPDGTSLQSKWDDEVAQIIKYGGGSSASKPEFLAAPNIPSHLFEDLKRIIGNMHDIAATHDVSLSRPPAGITSGVALEQLKEADDSQLAPQLNHSETTLANYASCVLEIMKARYAEKRLIGITGKNLSTEVKTFSGEQVNGYQRIRVSLGSSMPTSKSARQQYILALKKEGIITPQKTSELLELEDTDGLFFDIDRQAERAEIQEMLKGVPVEPMPWENHTIRLKVLGDFMMSEDFKKLQNDQEGQGIQIAHMIYEHYQQTQQMLLQEQQVMAGAESGNGPQNQPQNNKPGQAPAAG